MGGFPCVQLCIFRGVLWSPCGRLCVTFPVPLPCMTCDAADTTILCRGVGGTEGQPPPPPGPFASSPL